MKPQSNRTPPPPAEHTWRKQIIGSHVPLPPRVRKAQQSAILKVSEKQIQQSCEALLIADGWRIWHPEQNYSERKRKVVGESGAPDCHAVRYCLAGELILQGVDLSDRMESEKHVMADVLYIEFKRKGGKAQQNQKDWADQERRRGALVWIAGEDFEASVDGFITKYKASGLARKVRL